MLLMLTSVPGMALAETTGDASFMNPGKVGNGTEQQQQTQNNINCTGVVLDEMGEPLIGATIAVKGTAGGTITDINGNFQLSVPNGATLLISSIGYISVEAKVQGNKALSVVMKEDTQELNEVVVVGYNSVKKGQLTGALKVVKGKELDYMSSPTLENRLQGKTPGVMVSTGSGQPGTDNLSIRVRGTGSINGSNTPLYIMDGVMVEPSQFASLNSNDIADLQILKDASATAIYGSRGANGVIVITTKGGASGKTQFNYRNQFGFSKNRDYLEMMSGPENIQYQLQCAQSDPGSSMFPLMGALRREQNGEATPGDLEKLAKARGVDTDWIDLMTRTGFLMEHSVSASGGTDKTRFYISGSYLQQAGTLKKADMERFSGRFNIDHTANKYISLGLKASVGQSNINFSDPSGDKNRTSWVNPWFTALLAYPYDTPEEWINKDNPTLITKYYDNSQSKLKGVWSTYVKVNILDWLSVKSNFGMDYMYDRTKSVLHRDHPNSQGDKGFFDQGSSEIWRYTWTNTASVNRDFDNGHSLNAVVGMEMFQGQYYGSGFRGYDINPDMMQTPGGIGDKIGASANPPSVRGGATMSNLLSYFTQVGYGIGNKYNFSGSLRYDTSSKFHGDNKSALFWSLGAAWTLNQEEFLQDVKWLDLLKYRISYGTTGNQDGIGDFTTFDGFGNVSYNGNAGYVHDQLGNASLKWEKSAQFNTGVDVAFFENRLSATLDYYYIKTKDLFMSKQISSTSGFGSINTNAGSIANTGFEIGVSGDIIRTKEFKWNVGFNFTWNKNEILDLGTWSNDEGKFQSGNHVYEIGKPLRTWSMKEWAGVDPETGLVQFYDKDGGKTTEESKARYSTNMGSSEVPYFGGFNTSFSWKGLTLAADFTYALDYTVMNASRWFIDNHNFNGNKPKYMLDMWMKPGDVTDVPRFLTGTQPSPMASQFLEDASHLRLKTLRVNYLLPKRIVEKAKIFDSISFYLQGENLAVWTKYRGADPEINGDSDNMSYPKPMNFTFGFDFNF